MRVCESCMRVGNRVTGGIERKREVQLAERYSKPTGGDYLLVRASKNKMDFDEDKPSRSHIDFH